ncbi:MAG: Asparagine synthetase, partial [Parcubacteria group bacterium GW2011_GWA1_45_7]
MCGILGVAQFEKHGVTREVFERALDTLSHRGPDSFGIFSDQEVYLGNRRLSIIDLSPGGGQPMSLRCKKTRKKFQLVFNGELYNFKELRVILEQSGHVFRTGSDTEVVLHAFEQWGTDSFEKLRGMFALALWDEEKKKLFLARDRFGIKPLYFSQNHDYFAFASEIRALKSLIGNHVSIRQEAIYEFLRQGYISQPGTFYRGIRALEAGSFLVVSSDGIEAGKFFDLISYYDQEKYPHSFGEAVGEARSVLQDSVRHHMLSDVPTGLFLSGGIDSTTLLVSLREQGFENLSTVSAVFPDTAYDESPNIHALASSFKTDHYDVPISGLDFLVFLERIFEYMDQPTSDGVNTFFVSLAAKQAGLKVVLSGLGGDEIFGGYPSFIDIPRLRKINFGLRSFRNLGGFDVMARYRPFWGKASKLEEFSGERCVSDMWRAYRSLFTGRQIRMIMPDTPGDMDDGSGKETFCEKKHSVQSTISYYEMTRYMKNQLLRDSDVFSMAHSVELRVPFVDDFVMKFGTALPDSYKISGGKTKLILKEVLRSSVPRSILEAPKKGFVLPISLWMKNEAQGIIWDELGSSEFFDKKTIRDVLGLF